MMALHSSYLQELSRQNIIGLLLGSVAAYALTRCAYLLWFHPLAKYPGPRLAAVSNVWYGWAWFSGSYHRAMQKALNDYGDVVRIAPNELVFITPEAYAEIYTSTINGKPAFVKTDMLDSGDKHEGLASERDISKHRAARKQLAPAFSSKALVKYEPVIHAHVDAFAKKIEELTARFPEGFDICPWIERVSCDIGGEITMSHGFNHVQKEENSSWLDSYMQIGPWLTLQNVMRRFPLIKPLSYLYLLSTPFAALNLAALSGIARGIVRNRKPGGQFDYFSFFEKHSEKNGGIPEGFLVAQAMTLTFDHFEGSSVASAGIYFLAANPDAMKSLQNELRGTFQTEDEITDEMIHDLPWLNAIIQEILRIHTNVPYGLARESPGWAIDGNYVAKGCAVTTCAYATTHSERYFANPYKFAPERWLPASHPDFDEATYGRDNRQAFRPFSLGSRSCLGQPMAYLLLRILFSKIFWSFDWQLVNAGEVDWDRDLRLFMVWHKPELHVAVKRWK